MGCFGLSARQAPRFTLRFSPKLYAAVMELAGASAYELSGEPPPFQQKAESLTELHVSVDYLRLALFNDEIEEAEADGAPSAAHAPDSAASPRAPATWSSLAAPTPDLRAGPIPNMLAHAAALAAAAIEAAATPAATPAPCTPAPHELTGAVSSASTSAAAPPSASTAAALNTPGPLATMHLSRASIDGHTCARYYRLKAIAQRAQVKLDCPTRFASCATVWDSRPSLRGRMGEPGTPQRAKRMGSGIFRSPPPSTAGLGAAAPSALRLHLKYDNQPTRATKELK